MVSRHEQVPIVNSSDTLTYGTEEPCAVHALTGKNCSPGNPQQVTWADSQLDIDFEALLQSSRNDSKFRICFPSASKFSASNHISKLALTNPLHSSSSMLKNSESRERSHMIMCFLNVPSNVKPSRSADRRLAALR
jgi:hypothetical protein